MLVMTIIGGANSLILVDDYLDGPATTYSLVILGSQHHICDVILVDRGVVRTSHPVKVGLDTTCYYYFI